MKILINTEIGGFNIPKEITERLIKEKGFEEVEEIVYRQTYAKYCGELLIEGYTQKHAEMIIEREYYACKESGFIYKIREELIYGEEMVIRKNQYIIDIVEKMNEGSLKVVEIPEGIEVEIIEDYSGIEHIAEKHRKWF